MSITEYISPALEINAHTGVVYQPYAECGLYAQSQNMRLRM